MAPVLSGIDILLASPPAWKSKKIGLVTNHAAVTHTFRPARIALMEAGFNLVKLFSPEHGLDVSGADGQLIHDGYDPLTGLPVVSLYGPKLAPAREDLENLDLVLFDIPDVGSRCYTYLWTMTYVMEACASYNKLFILADRPNPLSGIPGLSEGPMLDEMSCSSFIGRWRLPVRHSCTLGELAIYFCDTRKIDCSLEVVPCVNWSRSMFYPDWSVSFVPTSPAIPAFESALLYPGLCFLEATNLSEGRSTSIPFRVAGAPWMQAEKTAELFNIMVAAHAGKGGPDYGAEGSGTRSGGTESIGTGGGGIESCAIGGGGAGGSEIGGGGAGSSGNETAVVARVIDFTPAEGKYAAQKCKGVMLHVLNLQTFYPVRAGWLLLRLIKDLHPDLFEWAHYPTQVNPSGKKHLDLLTGLPNAEELFESNQTAKPAEIEKYTTPGEWQDMIRPYLIYS